MTTPEEIKKLKAELTQMRDDFCELKILSRQRIVGEIDEHELLRAVHRLSLKHAHAYYPKDEKDLN